VIKSLFKMAPGEFHEQFSTLDVKGIPGYSNLYSPNWLDCLPRYDGNPSLAIPHIENFLRYVSEINVTLANVMMRLFVSSLGMEKRDWIKHCGGPKSITSIDLFFEIFLKHWGPPYQDNKEDEVVQTIQLEETSS
jgi:hypothetical protein